MTAQKVIAGILTAIGGTMALLIFLYAMAEAGSLFFAGSYLELWPHPNTDHFDQWGTIILWFEEAINVWGLPIGVALGLLTTASVVGEIDNLALAIVLAVLTMAVSTVAIAIVAGITSFFLFLMLGLLWLPIYIIYVVTGRSAALTIIAVGIGLASLFFSTGTSIVGAVVVIFTKED